MSNRIRGLPSMTISLQHAVDDLYRVAVTEGKSTSTVRLSRLAAYCKQELELRGLHNVELESTVPGVGRSKQWDVAWKYDGKYRLGISLKSLLKNLGGTVPNRVDDLMGEVANAQLYSPEIVLGYVMIFNVAEDKVSAQRGMSWLETLRTRLQSLSGRRPPAWATGMIESYVLVEVDFAESARLISDGSAFAGFFDALVEQVCLRNPNALVPPAITPESPLELPP
jgi:hypothetical protein